MLGFPKDQPPFVLQRKHKVERPSHGRCCGFVFKVKNQHQPLLFHCVNNFIRRLHNFYHFYHSVNNFIIHNLSLFQLTQSSVETSPSQTHNQEQLPLELSPLICFAPSFCNELQCKGETVNIFTLFDYIVPPFARGKKKTDLQCIVFNSQSAMIINLRLDEDNDCLFRLWM